MLSFKLSPTLEFFNQDFAHCRPEANHLSHGLYKFLMFGNYDIAKLPVDIGGDLLFSYRNSEHIWAMGREIQLS